MDEHAWIKGAERLIESALEAVDSMPVEKLGNYPKWKEARSKVYRAKKGLSDLRRLAECIARAEKNKA